MRDPLDYDTPDMFAPAPVRREPRLNNCFLCLGEEPCRSPDVCPVGTSYEDDTK